MLAFGSSRQRPLIHTSADLARGILRIQCANIAIHAAAFLENDDADLIVACFLNVNKCYYKDTKHYILSKLSIFGLKFIG